MRSTVIPFASPGRLPGVVVVLAALIGCGGGGTTSTSSGSGGAGGSAATSTSATTGTGTSTSTGLGMDGPPVPADAPVYTAKANAETTVKPGSQAGFGISGDGFGTFKLIWTGNTTKGNPAVKFEGSVWTTGAFSDIALGCSDDSCTLEDDDVVDPVTGAMGGGQYIHFKATSTDDLDGFEFSTDVEPVYFDLKYDGLAQTPRVVYVDAAAQSPANPQKIPFGITAP
jgi:hypothetical protein